MYSSLHVSKLCVNNELGMRKVGRVRERWPQRMSEFLCVCDSKLEDFNQSEMRIKLYVCRAVLSHEKKLFSDVIENLNGIFDGLIWIFSPSFLKSYHICSKFNKNTRKYAQLRFSKKFPNVIKSWEIFLFF